MPNTPARLTRYHKINILVDHQATAKLADFGLAILIEATKDGSTTMYLAEGTAAWMSPERLTAEMEDCSLQPAPPMDVYSFGILCHTVSFPSRYWL
jgi:serine/threonine protein kinase